MPPALIVLFSLFAWTQRGVYEDGFFFLRVVDVFLHSGDLSYNPGERYETNTDFLWTFLLIPGIAAGVDDILWLHIVGVSVYAAALWATFSLTRKMFPDSDAALAALVLLGTHFSFAYVAVTGFGAVLQALAAVCCLLALWKFGKSQSPQCGAALGFALLFLALCRLDSAVLGVPLVLCAIHFAWQSGKPAAPGIALALGIPSVLFGGVLLWKLWYYGDIFPATYYIKGATTQGNLDMTRFFIGRGATYAAFYWLKHFLWLFAGVAALGAWRALRRADKRRANGASPRRALLWTAAAMCVLWHGYMLRIGGDHYEFRMLMPQAPMLMILTAAGLCGLARNWRRAALAAMVVFSVLYWQRGFPTLRATFGPEELVLLHANVKGDGRDDFQDPDAWSVIPAAFTLWDWFGHLGKYHPEVRVASAAGGIAPYLAPLLWTERRGYADTRIGRANEDDTWRQLKVPTIGHNIFALPKLLARLGVNLIVPETVTSRPDFSRPPNPDIDIPARVQWAMAVALEFNLRSGTEFPPDSQLFALPLRKDGEFLPVLYFNRNETIDRILDERGIERVDVF